jgi:predicted O-methyltransferase YrrM
MTDQGLKKSVDKFVGRLGELAGQPFFEIYSQLLWRDVSDPMVGEIYDAISERSMVRRDVLIGYTALAVASRGTVLEIGPYVGGSTLALALGARARGERVFSLEKGGSLDHPVVPTTDIIADWRRNIEAFGLSQTAQLVEGNYGNLVTIEEFGRILEPESVGLYVQDADGHVDKTMNFAARWLHPDCLLAIDDYEAGENMKGALTRSVVDKAVRIGLFRELGLFGVGTWFGRLDGAERLTSGELVFVRVGSEAHSVKDRRFSVELPYVDDFAAAGDSNDDPRKSPLLLLENGCALGPAHEMHSRIESDGAGAYSHWRGHLHFATRHDEDPRETESKLEIVFKDKRYTLIVV